jgi:DNA-binding NtrC family response regulator
MNFRDKVIEYEKTLIIEALERNQHNREKTAQDLGIKRTTLVEKINRYAILSKQSEVIKCKRCLRLIEQIKILSRQNQ